MNFKIRVSYLIDYIFDWVSQWVSYQNYSLSNWRPIGQFIKWIQISATNICVFLC